MRLGKDGLYFSVCECTVFQIKPDAIKTEIFASFAVPTEIDDAYVMLEVDKESGLIATEYTPAESIIEKVCPIGKEIKKLLKDRNYLSNILVKGAKRADLIAKNNLKEIYEIIGLTKFS